MVTCGLFSVAALNAMSHKWSRGRMVEKNSTFLIIQATEKDEDPVPNAHNQDKEMIREARNSSSTSREGNPGSSLLFNTPLCN